MLSSYVLDVREVDVTQYVKGQILLLNLMYLFSTAIWALKLILCCC